MAGREGLDEYGEASPLEVLVLVFGSLKQLLPHQDLIADVGTGMQCCQHLMRGSLLGTLRTCVIWMCFAPQIFPVNLFAWYFHLG